MKAAKRTIREWFFPRHCERRAAVSERTRKCNLYTFITVAGRILAQEIVFPKEGEQKKSSFHLQEEVVIWRIVLNTQRHKIEAEKAKKSQVN